MTPSFECEREEDDASGGDEDEDDIEDLLQPVPPPPLRPPPPPPPVEPPVKKLPTKAPPLELGPRDSQPLNSFLLPPPPTNAPPAPRQVPPPPPPKPSKPSAAVPTKAVMNTPPPPPKAPPIPSKAPPPSIESKLYTAFQKHKEEPRREIAPQPPANGRGSGPQPAMPPPAQSPAAVLLAQGLTPSVASGVGNMLVPHQESGLYPDLGARLQSAFEEYKQRSAAFCSPGPTQAPNVSENCIGRAQC